MELKQVIDRVAGARGPSARESLAASGWLYEASASDRVRLMSEFKLRYTHLLAECIAQLGAPAQQYAYGRGSAAWYPEAICLATWPLASSTLFLALEHQDKEAPIAIVLGCLTTSEQEQLARGENAV